MKRTAFARPAFTPRPARQWDGDSLPTPRAPALRLVTPTPRAIVTIEKENAIQHAGYMNLVRQMACAHCGRAGPSQFCHSDQGKGAGIKTDCRRGWPGCADRPERVGCHTLLGSTGTFSRDMRRLLEDRYGAKTRAAVLASGAWPKSLPAWEEVAA